MSDQEERPGETDPDQDPPAVQTPAAPEAPATPPPPSAPEPTAAPELPAVEPAEPETGAPESDVEYLAADAGRRSGRRMTVLAAALLVVATFLGVLAARFYSADRSDDRRRDDVAEVAARLGLSFVTYDYRDLDSSIRRVRRDSTPGFYREYERFMKEEGGLLLERTQAQSKATVDDVFLGDIDGGSASAFVLLTVTRQGLGSSQPAAGAYLRLQLTKVDGKWLVEKVNPLFTDAATGAAVQGPQAAATTSTTAAP